MRMRTWFKQKVGPQLSSSFVSFHFFICRAGRCTLWAWKDMSSLITIMQILLKIWRWISQIRYVIINFTNNGHPCWLRVSSTTRKRLTDPRRISASSWPILISLGESAPAHWTSAGEALFSWIIHDQLLGSVYPLSHTHTHAHTLTYTHTWCKSWMSCAKSSME